MAAVEADAIRALLEQAFPDAVELTVEDRTGTGDHFQVIVESADFDGLSLIDQHRRVNAALAAPLGDGSIHELRIKTKGTAMKSLREQIEDVIKDEPVALFMKGTPEMVMCGNSYRALNALNAVGAPITTVDILPDPRIRQELSAISGWPTIPQVFVKGELVGGADITEELLESGGLAEKLDEALGSERAQEVKVVALALD